MNDLIYPKGHGAMTPMTVKREMPFEGQDFEIEAEVFVCPQCGLEAGTIETGGALQKTIADVDMANTGKHE